MISESSPQKFHGHQTSCRVGCNSFLCAVQLTQHCSQRQTCCVGFHLPQEMNKEAGKYKGDSQLNIPNMYQLRRLRPKKYKQHTKIIKIDNNIGIQGIRNLHNKALRMQN